MFYREISAVTKFVCTKEKCYFILILFIQCFIDIIIKRKLHILCLQELLWSLPLFPERMSSLNQRNCFIKGWVVSVGFCSACKAGTTGGPLSGLKMRWQWQPIARLRVVMQFRELRHS